MRTTSKRWAIPTLAVVTAAGPLLISGGVWCRAGAAEGSGAPVAGRISGRVADATTGRPVGGAPVRIRTLRRSADSAGRFAFDNVPAGNWVVTSDVILREGGFWGLFAGSVRYWAFTVARVDEGKETAVTIALKKHGDVEGTCRGCHPDRPTGNLAVQRCLHHSGTALRPAMAAKVAEYNRANEKAKKEKRPHFPPIVLEEGRRPDGSVDRIFNCESCHTAHVPTASRRYVLAPYAERSVLCEGCH